MTKGGEKKNEKNEKPRIRFKFASITLPFYLSMNLSLSLSLFRYVDRWTSE